MGSSAVTAALRYVHCSNCGGNALHSHVPCTVYLTTQARILHVDWLVAGRNRYRSTSAIASTAAALVVESHRAAAVQYSTVLYTQRSVSRSPHLTLTLPKQLGTHPINGDGHS
jgi:hypothetical protein